MKKKHSPNSQIPLALKAPDSAIAVRGTQASDTRTPFPKYSTYKTNRLETNIKQDY